MAEASPYLRRYDDLGLIVVFFSRRILTVVGEILIQTEKPVHSDAVVVLYTGIEYYPRLIEAATIFQEGLADKVVINGNRKSKVLTDLEGMGFRRCCPWHEDALRMLELLGVPRDRVMVISAENAYDTISEAKAAGKALIEAGVSSIILTTSKYHTRRAHHIWEHVYPNRFTICTVAARKDPYSPDSWWKEGRQICWVLSEYGAWIYYFWKTRGGIER